MKGIVENIQADVWYGRIKGRRGEHTKSEEKNLSKKWPEVRILVKCQNEVQKKSQQFVRLLKALEKLTVDNNNEYF